MFAVGVDVSNGRSTVAVLGAQRKIVMKPFEVPHTTDGFASLSEKLRGLNGEARIVMEHTGRYYESFAMSMHRAGFFVSAINPLVIKDYREGIDVRKVKTDKADALKIAQFAVTFVGSVEGVTFNGVRQTERALKTVSKPPVCAK